MSIKIFISYHDEHPLIQSDILTPIQTGCADAPKLFKGMLRDDTGDNISQHNRKYCELTAQYWVWKNYDKIGNPDYVGFMHYRRHFMFDGWHGRDDFVCNTDTYSYYRLVPCAVLRLEYAWQRQHCGGMDADDGRLQRRPQRIWNDAYVPYRPCRSDVSAVPGLCGVPRSVDNRLLVLVYRPAYRSACARPKEGRGQCCGYEARAPRHNRRRLFQAVAGIHVPYSRHGRLCAFAAG